MQAEKNIIFIQLFVMKCRDLEWKHRQFKLFSYRLVEDNIILFFTIDTQTSLKVSLLVRDNFY